MRKLMPRSLISELGTNFGRTKNTQRNHPVKLTLYELHGAAPHRHRALFHSLQDCANLASMLRRPAAFRAIVRLFLIHPESASTDMARRCRS